MPTAAQSLNLNWFNIDIQEWLSPLPIRAILIPVYEYLKS